MLSAATRSSYLTCRTTNQCEPVLTVGKGNWNELEAEVAGVGWDDGLSDAEGWDSEDQKWNTEEEDKDSDDGDMGKDAA